MYRSVAGGHAIFDADLDRLACPFLPICDPVLDGQLVRFDNEHLTARYAATLAGPVTKWLRDDGLLPR